MSYSFDLKTGKRISKIRLSVCDLVERDKILLEFKKTFEVLRVVTRKCTGYNTDCKYYVYITFSIDNLFSKKKK